MIKLFNDIHKIMKKKEIKFQPTKSPVNKYILTCTGSGHHHQCPKHKLGLPGSQVPSPVPKLIKVSPFVYKQLLKLFFFFFKYMIEHKDKTNKIP